LRAAKQLKKDKITAAVIDLYSIQPLDLQGLKEFIASHGNKVVVSEDHYAAGGIGEMLSAAFANTSIKTDYLSVREVPHSGSGAELLNTAKIDDEAIVHAAKKLLKA
jgi:transketolase